MIKFGKGKGNFSKTEAFLSKSLKFTKFKTVEEVIAQCVERLKEATPIDTGLTANSWEYQITRDKHLVHIEITNTNIQDGVNVALLLEFGHGTPSGKWIEGKDYIEPVVFAAYEKILNETWKEIKRL